MAVTLLANVYYQTSGLKWTMDHKLDIILPRVAVSLIILNKSTVDCY